MKKHITIPNCITATRFVGAIILIFTSVFSIPFYVVYTLCGLSDAVDGFIARAMKTETEFGARLDSIADITFYTILLLKLFHFLRGKLPVYIWYAVAVIIMVRLVSYIIAYIKYKKFASIHTYANKLTGLFIYSVPYLVKTWTLPICSTVCVVSFLSSLEEMLIHSLSKEYNPVNKSIFLIK